MDFIHPVTNVWLTRYGHAWPGAGRSRAGASWWRRGDMGGSSELRPHLSPPEISRTLCSDTVRRKLIGSGGPALKELLLMGQLDEFNEEWWVLWMFLCLISSSSSKKPIISFFVSVSRRRRRTCASSIGMISENENTASKMEHKSKPVLTNQEMTRTSMSHSSCECRNENLTNESFWIECVKENSHTVIFRLPNSVFERTRIWFWIVIWSVRLYDM